MATKILLTILPYWDPMIPPMGITSLKRHLQKKGYLVRTEDLIVQQEFLDFYHQYFKILEKIVPYEKRGNFNNIGHDVLQTQMIAHFNKKDNDKSYQELVQLIIYNHFYVNTSEKFVKEIIDNVENFYWKLEKFFSELLDQYKPDVLGVTAYKCTLPASLFVLKLAKEKMPKIKTIMGGGTFNESHSVDSPNFENLLNISQDYLDKIIIGEGEILIDEYLKGNLDNSKRYYTKEDIDNRYLEFKEKENPDFSDLDISKYPYLAATSSLSCIYDCSFCVAKRVGGEYRTKDPKQLGQEMNELRNKYNKQLFFMTDSLINPAITNISKEFIRQNYSFYFDAYFKVDVPSGDIRNTLLWRKGGLYRVRLGTESGSQKILEKMDKKITVSQIKDTVSALAFAGIKTTTYWVIGHPGETEEDFQMTLDLIEELKDDIYQAECNYFLYHYSQQASADLWSKSRMLLYPKKYNDLLVFKHWTLKLDPVREEAFRRVHRFEAHCRKLGIPNPYSLNEHLEADKRWSRLHKNAVPILTDFYGEEKNIQENLEIQESSFAINKREELLEF